MKNYDSKDIRNVAVLGHGSCGKTSLTGALCFAAGSSKRLGSVDEGNSLTDFTEDEIERKISINLSVAFAEWNKVKINLIDTPGYLDFIGDAYASVRAADCALITVHAISGVEIGTEMMFRLAAGRKMPTAIFINMLDKEHANFEKVLSQIRESFEGHFIPLTIPMGEGESFRGVVDILRRKACLGEPGAQKGEFKAQDVPSDMAGKVDAVYKEFIESVAELDEALMEKYFAEEPLTDEEILGALRKGVAERAVIPVFCGSAIKTFGIRQLLDGLAEIMPDPVMMPPRPSVKVEGGQEVMIEFKSGDPVCALVFKTISESHVGEMSYFRLMSGTIKNGDELINSNHGQPERLGHLSISLGRERIEVEQLTAGDIGVVAKLKGTHTGNTLSVKSRLVKLADIDFPKPVMNVAIEPKIRGEEEKIAGGLRKLQEEDLTLHSHFDPTLKQMIVSGMGELHLDVVLSKLKRKFNVEAEYVKPRIPYRETIRKKAQGQGKFKKQSGGRGQYGDCWVRLIPMEKGSGLAFEDCIVGGVIPGKFVPSVEKGVREAASRGVLAGYQVVDFKAECYDGSYHTVDSSDIAFQVAGSMAFQKVVMEADPVLLEPIQNVEVLVPEDYMGDVIGDLNSRRGRIMGMTSEGSFQKVAAKVPLAEMYKYSTSLRSMTQGRGMFTSEFSHYEETPREVQEKVVEESKKEKQQE